MRRLLLDSHTLIWFFENDLRLSPSSKVLVEDTGNEVFVSIASFWEIVIKKSLSKLTLKKSVGEMLSECANQQIEILSISQQDIEVVETLPFHHRDPFDRIIVAASITRNLEVVSIDNQFDAYPMSRIW